MACVLVAVTPLFKGQHADSRGPGIERKRWRQEATLPVTCPICLSDSPASEHRRCRACGALVGSGHDHSLTVDTLGRCGSCERAGYEVQPRSRSGQPGWYRGR